MGDPRKPKKAYQSPSHPWNRERMAEESQLVKEYGLKTKTEIWKSETKVRKFRRHAKTLIKAPVTDEQADKEKKDLLLKLNKLGLIEEGATVDQVLALTTSNLMERRLQTIVFRKKLANSINQARQFIVHGHIFVNGSKIDVPSYLVSLQEESTIGFNAKSTLADDSHPERTKDKKEEPVEEVVKNEEEFSEEALKKVEKVIGETA